MLVLGDQCQHLFSVTLAEFSGAFGVEMKLVIVAQPDDEITCAVGIVFGNWPIVSLNDPHGLLDRYARARLPATAHLLA